jgi:hypothetical protein
LTFIQDGNPSKINGLINIDKLRSLAERVLEIVALADKPYPFAHNGQIYNFISRLSVNKDQNELKALAAAIEDSGK